MRKFVWAGVICIALIALLGTYAVLAHNVIHGAVNGRSLYLSVRNESGTDTAAPQDSHTRCRRATSPHEWTCSVDDLSTSAGGTDYRVHVHSNTSCWDASGAGSLRHHISGCVHLSED